MPDEIRSNWQLIYFKIDTNIPFLLDMQFVPHINELSYNELQKARTYFNQIIDKIDEEITKRIESSILIKIKTNTLEIPKRKSRITYGKECDNPSCDCHK